MLPDENENNEEVVDEKVEEVADEVLQSEEQKDDRPERNYKAEIDRKNRENERLRQELEHAKNNSVQKRDQNDLSTWSDHELKAISNSNDPSVLQYKEQVNDILLERKVMHIRERERMQEKRALSDVEIRSKYPEALDPTSEFALKMEEVMYQFDLQKSPAGRLAAAKIVAADLGKGRSKASALDRKQEESRVRDVKTRMVDGDRSKPTGSESPKKAQELEDKIRNGDERTSMNALGDVLKQRGISRDDFFRKK